MLLPQVLWQSLHTLSAKKYIRLTKWAVIYGGAMASTGVVTLGKRVAVAGNALKTANFKINDNNTVALAA